MLSHSVAQETQPTARPVRYGGGESSALESSSAPGLLCGFGRHIGDENPSTFDAIQEMIYEQFAVPSRRALKALVLALVCGIAGLAVNCHSSVFLDEYFDTKDGVLANLGVKLRRRDGVWALLGFDRSPGNSSKSPLFVEKSLSAIVEQLNDLGVRDLMPFNDPDLQEGLWKQARDCEGLVPDLLRLCPCRVALCPISRLAFTLKNASVSLFIDTADASGLFTVACAVSNSAESMNCFLERIEPWISRSYPSKRYYVHASPDLPLVNEPAYDWSEWPDSQFGGLHPYLVPYHLLRQTAAYAAENSLSLYVAFRKLEYELSRPAFKNADESTSSSYKQSSNSSSVADLETSEYRSSAESFERVGESGSADEDEAIQSDTEAPIFSTTVDTGRVTTLAYSFNDLKFDDELECSSPD